MNNSEYLVDIKNLSNINKIKKISQSLALLDAILMPQWEFRYFSFNNHWDQYESMASMKDGSGDEYFILFNAGSAIGKVFTKEIKSLDLKKRILLGELIPTKFNSFIKEPAFSMDNISFCFWNENNDGWQSKFVDYNLPYLGFLTGNYNIYIDFVKEYYGKDINKEIVKIIFEHKPISDKLVKILNSSISLNDIKLDIDEIGYPN